jgi:hypothetical protein
MPCAFEMVVNAMDYCFRKQQPWAAFHKREGQKKFVTRLGAWFPWQHREFCLIWHSTVGFASK